MLPLRPRSRQGGVALRSIFLALCLHSIGLYLVVPLLPFRAMELGASSIALGIMQSSYALFQMAGTLVLGAASDRLGGSRVLLVCVLGSALALLAFSLAGSLWQLLLLRGLSGFVGGIQSICQALIAGVTVEDRTENMARLGAAFGLGLLVGPGLGSLLAPLGFRIAALSGALLTLATFFLVAWQFPKDAPLRLEGRAAPGGGIATAACGKRSAMVAQSRQLMLVLRHEASLGALFLSEFLQALTLGCLQGVQAIFYRDFYDYDASGMARLYLLAGLSRSGVSLLLSQSLFAGASFLALVGEQRCIFLGHGMRLIALIAMRGGRSLALLTPVLFAAGSALITPCTASMASWAAPKGARGLVLGAMQSCASAGNLLGPIIAGVLYEKDKWQPIQLCMAITCLAMLLAKAAAPGKPPTRSPASSGGALERQAGPRASP